MFNNYSISNKNIVSNHVNAVTGNITKTYAKSFFKRFNLKSRRADELLSPTPTLTIGYSSRCVEVVQMVVVGDMEVVAEIMFKEDYKEVISGC